MGPPAQTLAPRFVDAHVHISNSEDLVKIAAAGIVALRDAGMRDNAAQGTAPGAHHRGGPDVISACWALYKTGGYGSRFGVAVDSKKDIAAAILTLKKAGAGIIKIMASGMVSLKEPGTVTPGGFTTEELHFIVEEAAVRELSVMAHANGEQAIVAAAEAGVRSIEHGFFMTEQALAVMKKKGVFWVPTIGALKRAIDAGGASAATEKFIDRLIRSHLDAVRHAHAIGVPLAVGTDCVVPDARYQAAYDAELAYFIEAGIPNDEVIAIACQGGATLLGIE